MYVRFDGLQTPAHLRGGVVRSRTSLLLLIYLLTDPIVGDLQAIFDGNLHPFQHENAVKVVCGDKETYQWLPANYGAYESIVGVSSTHPHGPWNVVDRQIFLST
jgi:hypothetical protein